MSSLAFKREADKLKRGLLLIAIVVGALAMFKLESCLAQEGNASDRIVTEDEGELSKRLHLPVCEWYPKDTEPKGLLLAIHGLTLHGKRYDVVGKGFAVHGFYACAPDMRGFGRCYKDEGRKYWVGNESKARVNYNKSYEEIVELAKIIKEKHPNAPLFVMGESLGTSMCIKLAAEHPELVTGMILSGPTVKMHPLMVIHPDNMAAALGALLVHPRFNMPTTSFVKNLVSNDENIVQEMLNDPLCRKGLTIKELLQTDAFVKRTISNAKKLKPDLSILVLQGSEDRCFVPRGVTKLFHEVRSSDQTLRWLHAHGHLLLETSYLTPAAIDALYAWVLQHGTNHKSELTTIKKEIFELGAKEQSE